MAYENMTYEVILQRMMDRVTTQYPNLDNREGSIIFNALSPAAIELAIMYTELDNVLNESFVNTASREYILIGCEQMGMDTSIFEASAGVARRHAVRHALRELNHAARIAFAEIRLPFASRNKARRIALSFIVVIVA